MFVPKNILVPIDFSQCSEAALIAGREIAGCCDAMLHIVHVVDTDVNQMPFPIITQDKLAAVVSAAKETAVKEMHSITSKLIGRQQVSFETHIQEGIPYQQILSLAEKIKADLIVISPRGKSALEGFLFGSTTNKVVHDAKCDVMVVKRQIS